MKQDFKHTVRCFDDKSLTKHFTSVSEATAYANELLLDGHKCRVYPYRKPRTYLDILEERYKNGEINV